MDHIRNGAAAVRPYLYGPEELVAFVVTVFDATEVTRTPTPRGSHVELELQDSVVVIETGDRGAHDTTVASIYVYVPDVDEAYRRAIAAGATSIYEPTDHDYGDRGCGVRDSAGNVWWIGCYLGEG